MAMVANDLSFLTPEWLTEILTVKGQLDGGRVTEVQIKSSRERYVTSIHFLEVTYTPGACKQPSNRMFLKVYKSNLYHDISKAKEVEFYNYFPYNMPRIGFAFSYAADFLPDSNVAYVLMEDLIETHYSRFGSHKCSKEELAGVITTLGKFHAFWWENPKVGTEIEQYVTRASFDEYINDLESRFPIFVETMEENLKPEHRKVYEAIFQKSHLLFERLHQRKNITIVHGDANPFGNVLYPKNPAQDITYMIDWNSWRIHLGTKDIAYAIGLNFFPFQRAEFEQDILKLYYDTLLQHGVKGYSWEQFWYDYRLCIIVALMTPMTLCTWRIEMGVWWPYYIKGMQNYEDLNCGDILF